LGRRTHAIADGTHVKLHENNLIGSRHIRYGGYGGIAYHHIADTYIALFTSFISCGRMGGRLYLGRTDEELFGNPTGHASAAA
jgi:TnpA family transposase